MKKHLHVIALIISLVAVCSSAGAGTSSDLILPSISSGNLSNGLQVYTIRDDLPALTIIITVGCGSLYETQDNAGIASLLARNLSLSGSRSLPGNGLNQRIESMGGKLSVTSSWENLVITLTVLNRFRDEALSLLGEFISDPAFSEQSHQTARSIEMEELRRKNDDPATIAFEETRRIIFDGKGYGSVADADKISTFTLEQVKNYWLRHRGAANIIIGISSPGSFDDLKPLLEKNFSTIPGGQRIEYSFDPVAIKRVRENSGKIFFYPRDIPQSTVVVGTVAPDVAYPGNASLSVMNYLLGDGSFNSILMREIRVKRGLAYAVQSVVRPRWRTGVFLAYAGTKNESSGEVLSLLEQNIRSMGKNLSSDKDLLWVKNSIRNSYIFEFDTPVSVLTRYLNLAYNGLPKDYLVSWPSKISAVKAKDIRIEANRLFEPGLVRVVVGGPEARKKLEGMGEIVDLPARP